MSSSPPPTAVAAAAAAKISKGSIVVVESRTQPGINKPGGVARVTHVHLETAADGTETKKYDVSYVLGGKEKGVDEDYVTLPGGEGEKKRGGGGGLTISSTSTASLTPLATPKNDDSLANNRGGHEEVTSPIDDDNEEQLIEQRRKRKDRIQENILMGVDSQNSSCNSLVAAANTAPAKPHKKNEEPMVKKMKIAPEEPEKTDNESASSSSFQNHHKTAIWSARKNLEIRVKKAIVEGDDNNKNNESTTSSSTIIKRWRSHQIAEDYISLASAMVLPPTTHLGTFGYVPRLGQFPIEQMTALGYLTSPIRRPTVIEKWAPYEIATFEAALALHGKHFHQVQKWVKTKSTKDIIEFYYIWKKTSHYRRWKNSYCEEMESVCSSSEDDEEEEGGGGDNTKNMTDENDNNGLSPVRGRK